MGALLSLEHVTWLCESADVLLARPGKWAASDVLARMPSVDEIIPAIMTQKACCVLHSWAPGVNVFMLFAAVCEKLGEHDKVLEYAAAALDPDLTKADSTGPCTRTLAQGMQGRALAALGRGVEAAESLEIAATEANRHKLWLYELHALRDLKLLVLDGMGHGDHGSRRLGAVLRRLKGPSEKLSELLDGLDAAELARLGPPDTEYTVAYPAEQCDEVPGSAELRQELDGLRVMALLARARSEGVDDATLDAAMDGQSPKADIVRLLLERHAASDRSQGEELQALREELEGLRVMALHKRAASAGVDAATIEDAMDGEAPKAALVELLLAAQEWRR
eukprot:COSAG04_NODE_3397_length_2856_cov_1.203845_2_plen_336_part_00